MWLIRCAALGGLAIVMCNKACSFAASDDTLTVRETVGAVFQIGKHGTLWNLYARANPDAKQSLYAIVTNEKLARYHENALRIIGYIGDASDVSRLEKSVHRDFKGILTPHESDAIVAVFDALAIMSRRGIPEATQVLDKMLNRSYWKDIAFRWHPEEVKSLLNTVDDLVSYVLRAHPKTGRINDLEDKLIRVLNEVDDEHRRDLMAKRSPLKQLLAVEKRMRAAEQEAISQQLRQQLSTAFNGDLQDPAPRGVDAPASAPPKPEAKAPTDRRVTGDPKAFTNAFLGSDRDRAQS